MAWFNTAWKYRKKITITGQTGAGTNYQVAISIGASSGGDFHLGGNSADFPAGVDDGGDLRFTSDDGETLLGFWVESVAGSVATIWVKVPADLGSNQDIYVYYGNASATNGSDGDDVFLIYDVFDGSAVDTSKWTVTNGSPTVTGGELYLGVSGAINSEGLKTGSAGLKAYFNIRRTTTSDTFFGFKDVTDDDSIHLGNTSYGTMGAYTNGSYTYSLTQTGHGDNTNNNREYELTIEGTTLTYYSSGGVSGTRTLPNTVAGQTFYFAFGSGGASYPGQYVSHVRVRRFQTTEPDFSSAGAVEDVGVTTSAVTSIGGRTATGNGEITVPTGITVTQRGFCWDTVTAPTTADSTVVVAGTSGSYSGSLTGLSLNTLYYVRAYATTSSGTFYGNEVTFTTLVGFTNPSNAYASDNTYTTVPATSGVLSIRVSKDAGATWSVAKTKTFTAVESSETYGNGSTELWGFSLTRANMVDAQLRIELSHGDYSQIYKTFGFATGSELLTGLEIVVEGKYDSSTISIDHVKAKIHYGNSVLPIQAGSQAFATDGRKAGEGAGAGTGVLVFHDGSTWIACDTGTAVEA